MPWEKKFRLHGNEKRTEEVTPHLAGLLCTYQRIGPAACQDFDHQGQPRSFITSKGQEVDAIFHGLVRIVGRSAIFVQGTPWRKRLAGSLSHHHVMEAHCGSSHIQNYRIWLGWNPHSERIRPQYWLCAAIRYYQGRS